MKYGELYSRVMADHDAAARKKEMDGFAADRVKNEEALKAKEAEGFLPFETSDDELFDLMQEHLAETVDAQALIPAVARKPRNQSIDSGNIIPDSHPVGHVAEHHSDEGRPPREVQTFGPASLSAKDIQDFATQIGYPVQSHGRYSYDTKKGKVGHGGFGEVLLVHDEKLGRDVVIKQMKDSVKDIDDLTRFRREVIGAGVSSPFIAEIFDAFVDDKDGKVKFTAEYLSGGTFSDYLKERGTQEKEHGEVDWGVRYHDAAKVGYQMMSALEAVRTQRGGVHLDIKPSNILLSNPDDELMKLVDFGLYEDGTEALPNLDDDSKVRGTFEYMAPETIYNEEVDQWTDMYAVATVMYKALTGRTAYDYAGKDLYIQKGMGRPPRDVRDFVPEEQESPLLDVINTILSNERENRKTVVFDNTEITLETPGQAAKLIKEIIADQYPEENIVNRPPFVYGYPEVVADPNRHAERLSLYESIDVDVSDFEALEDEELPMYSSDLLMPAEPPPIPGDTRDADSANMIKDHMDDTMDMPMLDSALLKPAEPPEVPLDARHTQKVGPITRKIKHIFGRILGK